MITKRVGKDFFDYNQNARGKTSHHFFSKTSNSATVSMPVTWKDCQDIYPTDFTI